MKRNWAWDPQPPPAWEPNSFLGFCPGLLLVRLEHILFYPHFACLFLCIVLGRSAKPPGLEKVALLRNLGRILWGPYLEGVPLVTRARCSRGWTSAASWSGWATTAAGSLASGASLRCGWLQGPAAADPLLCAGAD